MQNESRQAHWEDVYTKKGENEVSWFRENPAPSLELIAQVGAKSASAIIDLQALARPSVVRFSLLILGDMLTRRLGAPINHSNSVCSAVALKPPHLHAVRRNGCTTGNRRPR